MAFSNPWEGFLFGETNYNGSARFQQLAHLRYNAAVGISFFGADLSGSQFSGSNMRTH